MAESFKTVSGGDMARFAASDPRRLAARLGSAR